MSTPSYRPWLAAALLFLCTFALPPAAQSKDHGGKEEGGEDRVGALDHPAIEALLNDAFMLTHEIGQDESRQVVAGMLGHIEELVVIDEHGEAQLQSLDLLNYVTEQAAAGGDEFPGLELSAKATGLWAQLGGSGAAHKKLGWKLTFWDEFSGPGSSGRDGVFYPADCYDMDATVPRCDWINGKADDCNNNPRRNPGRGNTLNLSNLAELNKCVWTVKDKINQWDFTRPRVSNNHPQMIRFEPFSPGSPNGVLVLEAERDDGFVDAFEPDCATDEILGPQGPWGAFPNSEGSPNCRIRTGALVSPPKAISPYISQIGHEGYTQMHGRFEFRVLMPMDYNTFPATWMVNEDDASVVDPAYYREIDVMEVTGRRTDDAHGSMHTLDEYPPFITPHPDDVGVSHPLAMSKGHHHYVDDDRYGMKWHTVAVEWDPGELRYYIDDLEIGRINDGDLIQARRKDEAPHVNFYDIPASLPILPMYLILNHSIANVGGQNLLTFPDGKEMDFKIDWVRVYERCTPGQEFCTFDTRESRIMTDLYGMQGTYLAERLDQTKGPALWSSALRHMNIGDFDGNGADDILLQNIDDMNHSSYLLSADGNGDFNYRRVLDNIPWMNRTLWARDHRYAHVGDFDGNGADDILLQNRDHQWHSGYLLMADGTGDFEISQVIDTQFGMLRKLWADHYRELNIGDFNGDGCDDVLLQNRDTQHHASYLLEATCTPSTTDPVFHYRQVITNSFNMLEALWADDLRELHVGDFNGDGCDDLLLQDRPSSGHAPYLLTATCTPSTTDPLFNNKVDITNAYGMIDALWADFYRKGHVGDFNGDGCDDFLLQSRTASGHATYLLYARCSGNPADPVFNNYQIATNSWGMNNNRWGADRRNLFVGDLNGDGAEDLILQGLTAVRSTLLLQANLGSGFDPVETIDTDYNMSTHFWSADHHTMGLGDFDGDGREDAVLQGDGTRNQYVRTRTSTGFNNCDMSLVPGDPNWNWQGCPLHDTYLMYLDRTP